MKPRNVNLLHQAEIAASSLNQRLAVAITRMTGNMWCAWIFLLLAILGFPGFHASLPAYVQWFSQTTLQLVFLPVLSVGQAVLNRHQELHAEETYSTSEKTFADTETIIRQNEELLKQAGILVQLLQSGK